MFSEGVGNEMIDSPAGGPRNGGVSPDKRAADRVSCRRGFLFQDCFGWWFLSSLE